MFVCLFVDRFSALFRNVSDPATLEVTTAGKGPSLYLILLFILAKDVWSIVSTTHAVSR